METEADHSVLLQILQAAESRRGFCAPNPAVGAAVVRDGRILARGRHFAAGHPHAEVEALQQLDKEALQGASLYVTLEPCCHQGKTAACTDLIIASGIKRVVFSMMDPNPLVAGKGMKALQAAGIDCQHVPLSEITEFYRSYVFWQEHQRPFVTLKLAISADHKIAGEHGSPVTITGKNCETLTHQFRLDSDAILTTAQTIISDDPQMNVRIADKVISKPVYILDTKCRLPLNARVLKTAASVTVYHADHCEEKKIKALEEQGVHCVPVPIYDQGLNLDVVLDDIGAEGVHDLWVEAGAQCFHAFYQGQLAQCVILYRSQKILGEHAVPAFLAPMDFKNFAWQEYGEDEVGVLISN